jgi:hypothetical protein
MTSLRYIALVLSVGCLSGCAHLHESNTTTSALSEAEVAALFQKKPDPRVLLNIPKMRHEALVLCVETDRDGTPEIFEKQQRYIDSLKQMLKKLQDEYFYWDDNPNDLTKIADEQAIHLAMLESPAYNGIRGGSGYEGAIYDQSIRIYENMIVTAAHGICGLLTNYGVTLSYEAWKVSWDDAAKMETRSNKGAAANRRYACQLDDFMKFDCHDCILESRSAAVAELERSAAPGGHLFRNRTGIGVVSRFQSGRSHTSLSRRTLRTSDASVPVHPNKGMERNFGTRLLDSPPFLFFLCQIADSYFIPFDRPEVAHRPR